MNKSLIIAAVAVPHVLAAIRALLAAGALAATGTLMVTAAFVATTTQSWCVEPAATARRESMLTWRDDNDKPHRITTTQDWLQKRRRIVQQVEAVMGPLPRPDDPVPLSPQIVSETEAAAVILKKVAYHTDSRTHQVRAWLLVPSGPSTKPLPAVLCLHQTTAVGKDEPAGLAGDPNLAYARELAERGFVVLAPDYPSFGEYEYDFENDAYASGSMKAIYDNRRAVDYLETLAEVDADRIAVVGHSLGGHNAIFTALFDARLKVVVSSCGFTCFHKYKQGDLTGWTSQRYMPRIRDRYHANPDEMPFDFSDLVAALAPRPFLAVAPLHDDNFEVSGVRDVMSAARPVYRLHAATASLQAEYPDCQHAFPLAQRQLAYAFIAQHLTRRHQDPR